MKQKLKKKHFIIPKQKSKQFFFTHSFEQISLTLSASTVLRLAQHLLSESYNRNKKKIQKSIEIHNIWKNNKYYTYEIWHKII